jgi:hypothetical protein
MSRHRTSTGLLVIAAVLPLLVSTACSKPPEQAQLTQFFRAAKARDNATLAMMSAAKFDPREEGTVESFDITSVSPDARKPINVKALLDAEKKAKDDEAAFAAKKMEYQTANLAVIEQVVKLERDPKAKMTPAQQAVKTAWDKWREDSTVRTRAVSDARTAVSRGLGPTEASLTQPGQPAFDINAFDGDLVSKDITIAAKVKSPSGQTADKTLTITMVRASGTQGGKAREGRWIITKIAGA